MPEGKGHLRPIQVSIYIILYTIHYGIVHFSGDRLLELSARLRSNFSMFKIICERGRDISDHVRAKFKK